MMCGLITINTIVFNLIPQNNVEPSKINLLVYQYMFLLKSKVPVSCQKTKKKSFYFSAIDTFYMLAGGIREFQSATINTYRF